MAVESQAPSSFETSSFQENKAASDPDEVVAVPRQPSLDLEADDADNPRSWSPKKKVSLALFVLLSAFVA